jgi:DNA-directed RNA polymerase subunit RPC12/RpoP
MAIEKLDLTCPSCGGHMEHDAAKKTLRCPYCGHEELLHQTDTDSLEAKAYARQKGILQANEEAEKRAKRRKRKGLLIVLCVVLALFSAAYAYYKLQPTVDPFSYITLSFSGITGDGTAELQVQSDDSGEVDPKKISYRVEPRRFLSEGDQVVVTASSSEYHLLPLTKTYTVTGLDKYLTDLGALSEKAVEMIHNKSDITVSTAIHGAGTSVKAKSSAPYVMFLTTDGKNSNTLYDVYLVRYPEKGGGSAKRFVVVYYKNIVVRDTKQPTMSYQSTMYTGQVIETLDNSYGGYMTGYKTLKDAKADILAHQSREVTLQTRKAKS